MRMCFVLKDFSYRAFQS